MIAGTNKATAGECDNRYTTKIIKAGALLADTKTLLAHWDLDCSVQANLQRIQHGCAPVDAPRSVERAGAKRPAAARGRAARTKTFEATPYEHSVIRGALSSGLKPREVAKLLKVPIGLVQAVAKDE